MSAIRRCGVLLAVLGLAACGGGAPSAEPSILPSASEAAGAALEVDSLAEVIFTDLIVRPAAGVDPATSSILAGRLTLRDRAYVVAGPVHADGYAWYQVGPLTRSDGSAAPFGWIAAASREGEAWVRHVDADCPGTVDLPSVLELQPLERLACFGSDSLELTAPVVSCGAGGGPWTWEPEWLGVPGGCALAPDSSGESGLLMRGPPGVTAPSGPGPVTVSGHFDDPASATCTVTTGDGDYPPPGPDEAVLICRTQFVIEGT